MGSRKRWCLSRMLAIGLTSAGLGLLVAASEPARAEYGDVVINNYSDAAGMRLLVFPHWFHRVRFRCKVCHADLGFQFKAGGNEINMLKIIDGQYCGACHNGEIAWAVENCNLCHSGNPGTPTQVHESTIQKLAVVAFVVGVTAMRPAALRIGRLGAELAQAPPERKEALGAELARLRRRVRVAGRVVAALLGVAILCMAVARYV